MSYDPDQNFLISSKDILYLDDDKEKILDYAAENGLGVELHIKEEDEGRIDEMKETLEDKGVKVRGVHADTEESKYNMTRNKEEMREYLDKISELSPEYVTMHTHLFTPSGEEIKDQLQRELVESAHEAVEESDYNGKVALENSSFGVMDLDNYDYPEDMHGYPLVREVEDIENISSIILGDHENVDDDYSDNVGITLDTNHILEPKEDLEDAYETAEDTIVNIHYHDGFDLDEETWKELAEVHFPGNGDELDETIAEQVRETEEKAREILREKGVETGDEEYITFPEGDGSTLGHVPPGMGERVPDDFLHIIRELGYDRNLTMEVNGKLLNENILEEFREQTV